MKLCIDQCVSCCGKMYSLTLFQTSPGFTCLQYESFENTVGKGEIALYEHFLFFPQCFLHVWITFFHFFSNLKLFSGESFSLEKSKICRLGKGLRNNLTAREKEMLLKLTVCRMVQNIL